MTRQEADLIVKEMEKHGLRRMNKLVENGFNDYTEGKNYGIMLMFEIAKEIVLKHAEKGD